jgi:hypothetical protein
MNRLTKAGPWLTRLILIFPVALFATIGIHNLCHLTTAAGARGIVFTSGMGTTVGRVGFGAFPLACSLFLVGCMFSERHLLTALTFVATLDSSVLIVRIASMFSDSSVRENAGLVRAEIFLLAFIGIGMLIELTRSRQLRPTGSSRVFPLHHRPGRRASGGAS